MEYTFKADPKKEIETLLAEIEAGALAGAQSSSRTSVYAMGPFSALLVRLAREADATANKVVRLTRQLFWLTVALVFVTAYLAWREFEKGQDPHNPRTNAQSEQTKGDPINVVHSIPPKQ